jgi:anti-sigma regulatory factor (Ser/Thr protein kinase)
VTAVRSGSASQADADVLELLGTVRAAGAARLHVHSLLSGTGCSADDLDLAVLLTSELVTNAVRHGAAPIVLQFHHWDSGVRIEVHDGGAEFCPAAPPDWDLRAEGGRGLALVETLATTWGSTAHPGETAGKSVWFEIVRSAPVPAAT